nr:acyltransferase [Lichenifustis flavocetrariae]
MGNPDSTGLPRAETKPVLASVQVLRGVAACMVLVFHASYMLNEQGGYNFSYTNAGAAGVDIFFVISGFIIAYITRGSCVSPSQFLGRRLIRIGPCYWFYTTVTLAILLAVPTAFAHLKLDVTHVELSYLMVLSNNNDHVIGTLLGVGWTVCFEAYFYVLVGGLIHLPLRYRTGTLCTIIVSGALLENVVTAPAFASVVFSALPLEFLIGYLFGGAYASGFAFRCTPAVAGIVIACLAIVVAGRENLVASELDPWRVLYFGLPAACLVAGCISLDARQVFTPPRVLTRIGDASYSLYLSHQFILYAIGKAWHGLGLHNLLPALSLLVAGVGSSLGYGILSYRWFERPLTRFLNGRLRRFELGQPRQMPEILDRPNA